MVDVALADVSELAGFKGAPFNTATVDGAADSVRSDCGWHIAPVVTTVKKMRGGGSVLILPTLNLVEVVSIKTTGGVEITGFDWLENGVVERWHGFPRFVEVEFRHGFEVCPPALLGVIAERASSGSYGRVKQESLGSRSVSLEGGYDTVGGAVVQKYTLPGRP